MKNYKLTIAYDGTRFYGWEHQPNTDMTIQGKLESVLTLMVEQERTDGTTDAAAKLEVIGAGRTDAGVHAKGMIANVHMETRRSCSQINDYLNRYLPEDICVLDVKEASDRFHSRYNAVGKTYCYTCYVGDKKPIFNRKYVHILESRPDIAAMRTAAALLVGEHDFASFCGNPKMKKSTVRQIYSIDIELNGSYLYMTFHGSGFLQYMVRILSGTLIEVGLGRRSADSMTELLEAKDRSKAGPTAPAKGLCMMKVDY